MQIWPSLQYFRSPTRIVQPYMIIHFTIAAEIHARSLVNLYCQYADRHMNLKFMRREREWEIRQSVIDSEFRHHIVKVVCGSTRLSPCGSTVTLTV